MLSGATIIVFWAVGDCLRFKPLRCYQHLTLVAATKWQIQTSLLAYLYDQNKSGFFGGPAFN